MGCIINKFTKDMIAIQKETYLKSNFNLWMIDHFQLCLKELDFYI